MKLYDKVIADAAAVLKDLPANCFPYEKGRMWKDLGSSEFIMQRDAALELGSGGAPSVNFTCATTSGLVDRDEVCVYGPDLPDLESGCAFARIVILETVEMCEDSDSEKAFQTIRNLDFVRYHVFPKGYMVRVSAQSNQEQVRISRQAMDAGISFSHIGNLYIKKFLETGSVRHVRVLFVTDREAVERLIPYADRVDEITKTLTHILDGMPTDCGHCDLKPVCDEVEGMKELHFRGASHREG